MPLRTTSRYWAVDALQAAGANVHLVAPSKLTAFEGRRVKNDQRDCQLLGDLMRAGMLPEAWISTPEVRQWRELVRYRAKLVGMRSGLKAQAHAVLAKHGMAVPIVVAVPSSELPRRPGAGKVDRRGRSYGPPGTPTRRAN